MTENEKLNEVADFLGKAIEKLQSLIDEGTLMNEDLCFAKGDEQDAKNQVETLLEEPDGEDCFPYNCHDFSDDADALASAGFGMDEDY